MKVVVEKGCSESLGANKQKQLRMQRIDIGRVGKHSASYTRLVFFRSVVCCGWLVGGLGCGRVHWGVRVGKGERREAR